MTLISHGLRRRAGRTLGLCLVALSLAGGSIAARPHDEYRFVGTVVKYDAAKARLEMTARETDENGRVTEFPVRMSVPMDVEVTRTLKKVSRSELKPGVFIIVNAAGVEMIEIDARTIEIVVPPKPAKPAPSQPATTKPSPAAAKAAPASTKKP